jgi:uncharacterized membrane protein
MRDTVILILAVLIVLSWLVYAYCLIMARRNLERFMSYLPLFAKEGYSQEMVRWRTRSYWSMAAFFALCLLTTLFSIVIKKES